MIGRTVVNGLKAESYNITCNITRTDYSSLFYSSGSNEFGSGTNMVIKGNITDVSQMFYSQTYYSGSITFDCNPTSTYNCLYRVGRNNRSESTVVNYTAICTKIDYIISSKGSQSIDSNVVKGILVV